MTNTQNTLDTTFRLMRTTFVLLPIAAGADKFFHLLTDWDKYLNPNLASLLPFSPHTFMLIVGVIEIAAGVIVLVNARIGGYIVALWLASIALTLLLGGMYLDVAVRDLVLAISAFSMAQLSKISRK